MTTRLGIEKIVVGKTKKARFLRHNLPKARKFGKAKNRCVRCGNAKSCIGKYNLNICRRCFREIAPRIGFKKNR